MEVWGLSITRHSSIFALLAPPPTRLIGRRSCQRLRLRLDRRSFATTTTTDTNNDSANHSSSPSIPDSPSQPVVKLSRRAARRSKRQLPITLRPNRPPYLDFASMTSFIQLTSVPAADTPQTCLSVRCGSSQYVFGRVGEGTQRAFAVCGSGFSGTREIFLSGPVGWDQLGGLLGYLLSVGSATTAMKQSLVEENEKRKSRGKEPLQPVAGVGKVGLHAAANICHTMATSRGLIFRQPVWLGLNELRDDPRSENPNNVDPDWQDTSIRVWKVPVTRERSSSPPKRRRLSSEEDDAAAPANGANGSSVTKGDEFKAPQTLSGPEVAQVIVQKYTFNGDLETRMKFSSSTTVGELKPTDVAFIKDNGTLRIYKRPGVDDVDAVAPNPQQPAWVVSESDGTTTEESENVLELKDEPLPRTTYSDTSMSYIAKFPNRRGKFDRATAEALGVAPRDFKFLAAGEPVTTKDGNVVQPEQVLGNELPGAGFIVADIASRDYIDSFVNRPEWRNKELMANVAIMYWLLGPGLYNDSRVQKFIQEHSNLKHIVTAPETCPNRIINAKSAGLQMMLNRVDPERFPILKYDNTVKAPAPTADSPVEFGRLGHRTTLMPRVTYDEIPKSSFPDLLAAAKSVPEDILALAAEAKAKATDPAFLARIEEEDRDIPNRDAEVVALGTGSSMPGLLRNVSGTLLLVPGVGNYLFDCGEGTIGQIRRLYGDERTTEILRDLRCVVISHIHADHHLGCISVVRAWYEQALRDGRGDDTLAVSCISRYYQTLKELSWVEDFGFHRLRFPSCTAHKQSKALATEEHLRDYGLAAIRRVFVPHCWLSMGTEIELISGLRVAYSGDCRPSSGFAAACRGAHLLIHECTFSDSEAKDAKAKMHSTMSEALSVADEMQARLVMLTHFSQRYNKGTSEEDDAAVAAASNNKERPVVWAFDFMTVKLGDFKKAACYRPAIAALMKDQED